MISLKGFILPLASNILRPKICIASPDSFVGLTIRVIIERKAVPASEPLMPWLAIRPTARAVSCILNPNAPATGAAYLNVCPIRATFVFELVAAEANTSANIAESLACKPNADKLSVTISEVVAKSSPEAEARFMIPSIPPIISLVFQPAIPIYLNASADSVAVYLVAAPISIAFFFSCKNSSAVAPEIAFTFDISFSKSAYFLMPFAMPKLIPAIPAICIVAPNIAPLNRLPIAPTLPARFCLTLTVAV